MNLPWQFYNKPTNQSANQYLALSAAEGFGAFHADLVESLHETVGAGANRESGVEHLRLPALVLGILQSLFVVSSQVIKLKGRRSTVKRRRDEIMMGLFLNER